MTQAFLYAMTRGFVAKKSVLINASPSRVWDALTNPSMIEKYLFGTKVTSDWKVGSKTPTVELGRASRTKTRVRS
jgi:uncharacterized protein YndB with AHSA1/START domain